jgi:hypothetical protein
VGDVSSPVNVAAAAYKARSPAEPCSPRSEAPSNLITRLDRREGSDPVVPAGDSPKALASVPAMRPNVAMPVSIRNVPAMRPFSVTGTMSP